MNGFYPLPAQSPSAPRAPAPATLATPAATPHCHRSLLRRRSLGPRAYRCLVPRCRKYVDHILVVFGRYIPTALTVLTACAHSLAPALLRRSATSRHSACALGRPAATQGEMDAWGTWPPSDQYMQFSMPAFEQSQPVNVRAPPRPRPVRRSGCCCLGLESPRDLQP